MARNPCKKELFISSCISEPPWMDYAMRRIREEQERQYVKELLGVPVYKVNTEDFKIDYFTRPYIICYDGDVKPNCIVKIEKENNKMEAKKCDRCGKLYETDEYSEGTVSAFFKHEKVGSYEKETYSEFHNHEIRVHKMRIMRVASSAVDLCPECRESFKKWFEEG